MGLELGREVVVELLDKSDSLGRAHWDGPTEDSERGKHTQPNQWDPPSQCPILPHCEGQLLPYLPSSPLGHVDLPHDLV